MWMLAICAMIGGYGLVATVIAWRRGHELLGVLIVAFTGMLVSPVTWPPHGVWILPALVWLWFATWRTRSVWPRVSFAVGTLWFVVPAYWPAMRFDAGGVPFQYTLDGNLLATLGGPTTPVVLALASLPWWLRRLVPPQPLDDALASDVSASSRVARPER